MTQKETLLACANAMRLIAAIYEEQADILAEALLRKQAIAAKIEANRAGEKAQRYEELASDALVW